MKKTKLLLAVSFFSSMAFAQNVGIGTTRPTEKLHVAGNVKADTIKPSAIKFTPNAGEGKVLTSDAAGNASWKFPEKSIFKATGFLGSFIVAPNASRILTDWRTVELNVGSNSIFVNAQGDLFVLKDGFYKVSAKITVQFADPGDSHSVILSILVNGAIKYSTRCAVPTNDNLTDINQVRFSIIVHSIYQLRAQDKISFEFDNDFSSNSNTSAQIFSENHLGEFVVEQL